MEFIREDCIYARQSVDRKDSISIESQIDFCKYELKGGSCRVFKDKGYSGKNTDRPEFQKLLGEIRKGKVRRVIVYKLDRISRSILDFTTMMGSIQKLKPIVRSTAAYAPPEVVDGKPPVYPYTPIKSDFEDAGTVEEMMLYTELQSAVHAMIQRLEYSFTFNPSLLTSPKRKKQVTEILTEAEKYIWRIKEEIRCA